MRHYAPVTEDRSWVRVGEVDLYVVTLGLYAYELIHDSQVFFALSQMKAS